MKSSKALKYTYLTLLLKVYTLEDLLRYMIEKL